jgi:glycosyltransferase involved in cell wall biosynthesis
VNLVWLSADPVVEGALGVTDRIEGARYFARRGDRVLMVTGGANDDRPCDGVPTRIVPARYVPFIAWLTLWPRVLRALQDLPFRADAVISDFGLLPPAMRWRRTLAPASRPAVVLDVRSHPVEAGALRLAAQRARFAMTLRTYGHAADAVTTIGPELRNHVARLAGIPVEPIGIWTSGCAWCDRAPDVSGDDPLPADLRGRFVVLYHGMITAGRGLADAIRGVAIAGRSAPDLTLVLLGDGGARRELERLVARLGATGHIRFLDPVPHDRVPAFLRTADVGLAPWPPSWDMQANRPLKLTEYLCSGLPVVMTDITPHRIVPHDASFAFWAGDGTPEAFASAILSARAVGPELRGRGRLAAAWAAPRLGWSRQFEILEDTVHRCLARRGSDAIRR